MFKQKFISKRIQEAFGEPVGDPFGGPAYGQRTFLGLIAGAVSIFQGVTALAGATTMLATIAAGAAIVGGALSVIGNLTGDANLSKIGGIIGLGGAAIGMFSGDGFFGEMFSDAFGGGGEVAGAGISGVTPGMEGMSGITPSVGMEGMTLNTPQGVLAPVTQAPTTVGADIVGGMPQITPQAPASTGVEWGMYGDTGMAPSIIDQGGIAAIGSADASGAIAALDGNSVDMGLGSGLKIGGSPNPGDGLNPNLQGLTNPKQADTGILSGVGKFVKENDTLLKWGGDFVKGLMGDKKKEAETLLAQAAAGNKEAETELMKLKTQIMGQQATNANTVVSVAPMATGSGTVSRNQYGLLAPRTQFAA